MVIRLRLQLKKKKMFDQNTELDLKKRSPTSFNSHFVIEFLRTNQLHITLATAGSHEFSAIKNLHQLTSTNLF